MGHNTSQLLKGMGLTNSDCADLTELQSSVKRELRAFCSSQSCYGLGRYSSKGKHKAGVPNSSHSCPDCGHSLFWAWVSAGSSEGKE